MKIYIPVCVVFGDDPIRDLEGEHEGFTSREAAQAVVDAWLAENAHCYGTVWEVTVREA